MATRKKMGSRQVNKRDKELYTKLLHQFGEQGLYEKTCGAGMLNSAASPDADIEMLNLSESFFQLYRKTGNEDYATVSRVLRRAAHRVMRELVKQRKEKVPDPRFLIQVA